MQVRVVQENEIAAIKELWDYCFDKQDTPFFKWYFSQYCPLENTVLGAFIGDDLAGMLHLNPYTICLNGNHIDTSYIVGVATAPQHRRKGVLKNLLIESFNKMTENGQSLAILMPSAVGVYLPYGFAFCYEQIRYQMPILELVDTFSKVEKADINFVTVKDYKILQDIYDEFTKNLNGFVVRKQREWQFMLSEHIEEKGYIVAVKKNNKYLGYMLYLIADDTFKIVELICLDEGVKASLLSYASQHFSQCEKLFWQAPANDLTYLSFDNNRYYPSIWPFMVSRILDPVKALAEINLSMPDDEMINIEITDNILTKNNAVFKLQGKKNIATMKKVSDTADVKIDIGSLAQLYFAAYSVDDLYNAGYIKVYNEASIDILKKVFIPRTNYINEYF